MRFVVKRSEWYRGQGGVSSVLLRKEDNLKCCLGFFALQCGIPITFIEGITAPQSMLEKNKIKSASWLPPPMRFLLDDSRFSDRGYEDSLAGNQLMRANDRMLSEDGDYLTSHGIMPLEPPLNFYDSSSTFESRQAWNQRAFTPEQHAAYEQYREQTLTNLFAVQDLEIVFED